MYDPIFMSRVTMALYEDRLRSLQRSRSERPFSPGRLVRRTLTLYRPLARTQPTPPCAACRCAVSIRG
jgi:hypothetical protein